MPSSHGNQGNMACGSEVRRRDRLTSARSFSQQCGFVLHWLRRASLRNPQQAAAARDAVQPCLQVLRLRHEMPSSHGALLSGCDPAGRTAMGRVVRGLAGRPFLSALRSGCGTRCRTAMDQGEECGVCRFPFVLAVIACHGGRGFRQPLETANVTFCSQLTFCFRNLWRFWAVFCFLLSYFGILSSRWGSAQEGVACAGNGVSTKEEALALREGGPPREPGWLTGDGKSKSVWPQ